jgi:hypothetical protein
MTHQPPSEKRRKTPRSGSADPEQYQRFLDAARKLGCEENAKRLDEVVRRTAKMPPPRRDEDEGEEGLKA